MWRCVFCQVIQLPKPLWNEVLELCGGEHATMSRAAFTQRQARQARNKEAEGATSGDDDDNDDNEGTPMSGGEGEETNDTNKADDDERA